MKEIQTKEYKKWREQALINAKNQCFFCKSEEKLNVHHIFPVKSFKNLILDNQNALVLCETCHKSLHGHSTYS